MSVSVISDEKCLTRADLPLFHEMAASDQAVLWDDAQVHFAEELAYFASCETYPDLEAVVCGVKSETIVPVTQKPGCYGIVSPIRDRYDLSQGLKNNQASVPYLHSEARNVLDSLAEDFHCLSRRDEEFKAGLQQQGFSTIRLSVCSLLRTTQYQRFIASQGRFALGRDNDGPNVTSTHEKARAFDIDHASFYAKRTSGQEVALNRNSTDVDFSSLGKLLPGFKNLLKQVVSAYQADGTIMALEEVPDGWGCWHIAVK